jgi:hypothetical protein
VTGESILLWKVSMELIIVSNLSMLYELWREIHDIEW